MFKPTSNLYRFQFLITGITGTGIEQVYLPEEPPDDQVLFIDEQKWTRPQMPPALKKAGEEWKARTEDEKHPQYDPDFVPAMADKIIAWQEQEWDRSTNGVWIWVNGKKVYLTGFYYWYLSVWQTYFGYPIFRATDVEITYWIQYIIEDPDCYGGALNTIRRYGKSSIFGAFLVYRAIRNRNHTVGMQGETQAKVAKFYNLMVLKPFTKLPYYYVPIYDVSSTQRNEIKFEKAPKRGKSRHIDSNVDVLESVIDYRSTGAAEYDGSALDTYYVEEAGKIMEASIYSEDGDGIMDIVKPALRKGRQIRGKAMLATTCEFMDATDRGGKAYKELFYDSDFNQRQKDGRTKSGLYASFLPGDCAYEDFLDEWGYPMRDLARQAILDERDSFKNNPSKLAGSIRRYPLSIMEIFYINPARCIFSSPDVLQEAIRKIDTTVGSLYSTIDLSWENNIPFTKVIWRQNDLNGWLKINDWPDFKDMNKVGRRSAGGKTFYYPENDETFAIGFDPVQMRLDTKKTGRESRPVAMIKRKYDPNIDGVMDGDMMRERAAAKHPYKTNRYIAMMDKRPNDPNILFERMILVCWALGCSVHVEKQKDAVISFFHDRGCGDFIMAKYSHDYEGPQQMSEGTAASPRLIEDYTTVYDSWITNFGHTIVFREQAEDALHFKPKDTQEHDYTVAAGFAELACKMKPKVMKREIKDLSDFMPILDQFGNRVA